MRFGILGPLEVLDGGGVPIDAGGRQPRLVLAALVAAAGRPVAVDALVEALWGEDPPRSAVGTLQSYVSRLRRQLDDSAPLRFDDLGYRLDVAPEQVDFRRFEALADQGRSALEAGDPAAARASLREAESLWRGSALAGIADLELFAGLATRLEERRRTARDDRLEADLALGRHAAVVGELGELVAEDPLRERRQELLALALYRSGRQADALRSLADAGRTLRDELGIEPSRPLRDLEAAILAHDPALDPPTPSPAPVSPAEPSAPPTLPAGAAASTSAPDGGSTSSLVGRATELDELRSLLDGSATVARFAVVEGEPGIGKTRLVEELRLEAERRGAVAVWGRADEGGAAPALWPWLGPLRAIADAAAEVPAALEELLAGEVPMAPGNALMEQFERFDAVARLLASVGATRPVVVLLDDLQWADATSLELLAFLAGAAGPGLLVVGTLRTLAVDRRQEVTDALAAIARRAGSRRLVLRGLDRDATAEVVGRVTERDLPPGLAAEIHARAEGNPFFAIELSRLIDDEGGLGDQVPGGVGDVIRRRLARLPTETGELLRPAAVVGRDVALSLLPATTGRSLDQVLDVVEPAIVQQVLVEVPDDPGTLRFSHALIREVLLEDLTVPRRARLHLQVADAIEARGTGIDDAEILAEHLWRAAPVGVEVRAAEALERAAEVALRRVAYAAAEDLLTKAAQLRRRTSRTVDDQLVELRTLRRLLEVARARHYFEGSRRTDAMERAKELARAIGERDVLLDLLWFEVSAAATAVRLADSERLIRQMEVEFGDDERPEVQAFTTQLQAVWHWGHGRLTEGLAGCHAAMELIAQSPPAVSEFGEEMRMVAGCFLRFHQAVCGEVPPEQVQASFDEMLDGLDDRFGVVSICGFAATTSACVGQWAAVRHFTDASQAADPGNQYLFWAGQKQMHQAMVLARDDEPEEAVATFDEGWNRYTGIGGASGLGMFAADLALCFVERGQLDLAERYLLQGRDAVAERGEGWPRSVLALAEAELLLARGEQERSVAAFAESVRIATTQGAHQLAERARTLARRHGIELPA